MRRWQASSPRAPQVAVEPGPGQESVWDYPRPPRVKPVQWELRVEHHGRVIARTRQGLRMLETASAPTYYFPPGDVDRSSLRRSLTSTHCEWKGEATHWALRVGDRFIPDLAWSYEQPYDEYNELCGYLAFYPGRVDACWVGDQRATAQPGGFYGGWITSNIVGPFKGDPGTGGW